MELIVEARRAGGQRRASGNVLADFSVITVSPLTVQAASHFARSNISSALARAVAEHAYSVGARR